MNGKTHILIGLTTGLWLAYLTPAPPLEAALMATAAGIAALLPDIDHPNSKISHKVRPARLLFMWFGHRGFTHSILAQALIVLAAVALLPQPYASAVSVGYGSHIIADMMTVGGVRLLYPLHQFISFPVVVRTNGVGELMVRCLVAVACLYCMFQLSGLNTLMVSP